jgi:hypothetical protein
LFVVSCHWCWYGADAGDLETSEVGAELTRVDYNSRRLLHWTLAATGWRGTQEGFGEGRQAVYVTAGGKKNNKPNSKP